MPARLDSPWDVRESIPLGRLGAQGDINKDRWSVKGRFCRFLVLVVP
jgi:hypothetical protein